MKIKNIFSLLVIATLLSGCMQTVTTKTVFYSPDHSSRGSIAIIPVDKSIASSLSFQPKETFLGAQLEKQGYKVVDSDSQPEFIAFISYGVDGGKETIDSIPIFGQTGGGTSYHSGTVNSFGGGFGSYSGTSYSMPTYGIVGSSTVSSTEYSRHLDIDIVDANSIDGTTPKKRYEIRAKSKGSCPTIEAVFKGMVDAIFQEFPGENGKTITVSLDTRKDEGC